MIPPPHEMSFLGIRQDAAKEVVSLPLPLSFCILTSLLLFYRFYTIFDDRH